MLKLNVRSQPPKQSLILFSFLNDFYALFSKSKAFFFLVLLPMPSALLISHQSRPNSTFRAMLISSEIPLGLIYSICAAISSSRPSSI